MKPPSTYSEWANALDAFGMGGHDEEVLCAMEGGCLEWGPVVSERFTARLRTAIDTRLEQLQKRQKALAVRASSERDIVAYLLAYRREFGTLKRLVSVRAVPNDVQQAFRSMVAQCAQRAQESLELSAKEDRSGRLPALIRKTRVDLF